MHTSTLFAALGLCAISLVNAIPVSHPFSHNAFVKRSSGPKAVFAHFMMGNAFPYTQKDFEDDVKLASASGIDAFALNIGTDSWQPDHVKMAYVCFNSTFFGGVQSLILISCRYDAAAASGTGFKMFISFDMTCVNPSELKFMMDAS